ncbi:hypothetical protein K1719_041238 [Acacia pycnantha]|nr:hypothetical protein K1719_041238 [Acacia pycnantha]
MGSSEEGGENGGCNNEESQKKVKPYLKLIFLLSLLGFLWSFLDQVFPRNNMKKKNKSTISRDSERRRHG